MATYSYARASGIRNRVKEYGKRCGRDFLHALDKHIEEIVNRCCEHFNGHKKTLTATDVELVVGKRR